MHGRRIRVVVPALGNEAEDLELAAGEQPLSSGGPPVMLQSISTTSVAIELDQPLVADPEVMRDLVEHDVPDLAA